MACFNDLPDEIILLIFKFYLDHSNQRNLLKLAKVCRLWETISQTSDLWLKFDGTVPYNKMKSLYSQGYLDATKELTFSEVQFLSPKDAAKFFASLRSVEVINFSLVENLSNSVLLELTRSNLKLKEIEIGCKKHAEKAVNGRKLQPLKCSGFEEFLNYKGESLTTLKVSFYYISSASQILKGISICCPNLEHLNFTSNFCCTGTFPLKSFQENCPKLRVLHLDSSISIENLGKHSVGFPNLEVFTYNDLNSFSHMRDKDLEYILFNSPNLKFLNLLNCSVSVGVLCSLPAQSLEYLFLSRSKAAGSDNLSDVFKKWCYTLKQVDVSYVSNVSVNKAINILTDLTTESPIEFLDLSYTQINSDAVENILEKCKRIDTLNLTGCRNLQRGFKRNYSGKKELHDLLENLRGYSYNASTDEEMSM